MKYMIDRVFMRTLAQLLVMGWAAAGVWAQQTGSATARPPGTLMLTGEIKWKKSLGVPPADASGNYKPAANICQPFFITVHDAANPQGPPIATNSQLTRGPEHPDYYRCKYEMYLPPGRPYVVQAGMLDHFDSLAWAPPHPSNAGNTVAQLPDSIRRIVEYPERRTFDRNYKTLTLTGPQATWLAFELGYSTDFQSRIRLFHAEEIGVAYNWDFKALDWCRDWETGCGKPAADAFCMSKGYEAAKTFTKRLNVPETLTIGDKRLCNKATRGQCDGFEQIECVRK